MANSPAVVKETGSPDSKLSENQRRRKPQGLPYLNRDNYARSVSVQFAPSNASKGNAGSRMYVSSIEPVHLRPPATATENSYQIGPKILFPIVQIEKIARDTLNNFLEGTVYDEATCRQLSLDICDEIQTKIKRLKVPRYKFVSYVHIGQLLGQDIRIASRCLWDTNVDNCASVDFRSKHLFASACIFGFYYE